MNEFMNDSRLSWKAIGLYGLLYELNDEYISLEKLKKYSKGGIHTIRTARDELIKFGYLRIERIREKGKIKGIKWIIKKQREDYPNGD